MNERLSIVPYDTTLRDGAQTPGVNLSVGNKLRITEALDDFGFPYIEGGWPGANPTDIDFFREVKGLKLKNAELVAFGMTGKVQMQAPDDPLLQKLLSAETGIVTIFGKSWMLHVRHALRTTGAKNLNSIAGTVSFLKSEGRRVFYDAEHFFDGYFDDRDYAIDTLKAAQQSGAEVIILCDTNGGRTPEEVFEATRDVKRSLGEAFPLGIHVHDDGGLAVASTIAAVKAGVIQVQGTINGAGERAGNLDFCEFLPTAKYKYGIDVNGVDLTKTKPLSRFVEMENRLAVPANKAYVAKNSFTHKGGVHVSAMRRHPKAYQHIDPALVGAETSFEHSDQGGGANIEHLAEKHGFSVKKGSKEFKKLVQEMKSLKVLGDAQEFLMLYRILEDPQEIFELTDETSVDVSRGGMNFAHVAVSFEGRDPDPDEEDTTWNDDIGGSFNAFVQGFRYVVMRRYPSVEGIELLDYRVDTAKRQFKAGTDAEVEVFMEFGVNGERWTSIRRNVDEQIANQDAFVDGYKYFLLKRRKERKEKISSQS